MSADDTFPFALAYSEAGRSQSGVPTIDVLDQGRSRFPEFQLTLSDGEP